MSALYRPVPTRRSARRKIRLLTAAAVAGMAALAALAPACGRARAERPHVLLVVLSGARPDHMSAYGYARATTPAVAKLAATGTLFDNAVTTAPWALTAQASLATGLHPSEHAAAFDHPVLEPRLETLAEKMKAAGYDTFGVSTDELIGQANGFGQGFDVFKEVRPAQQGLPDEGGAAAESELLGWLEARPDTARPWFAQVTLVNPRLPFNPQGDFRQKFLEQPVPLPRLDQMTQFWVPFARRFTLDLETLGPDEMAALVSLYDGEIAYADYRLGRMIEALEKQGMFDDTLVVLTADAGEDLGDHGALADVSNVWDTIVRVPLVMRLPGRVPSGRREAAQVQTVDLMEAVMRLTAPPAPVPPDPQASPMRHRPAAVIEARFDPAAVRYYESVMPAGDAVIFRRNLLAVRTDDRKYILNSLGGVALFDLKADPHERHSIAAERPDEAREMNARLSAWAADLTTPFASPAGAQPGPSGPQLPAGTPPPAPVPPPAGPR